MAEGSSSGIGKSERKKSVQDLVKQFQTAEQTSLKAEKPPTTVSVSNKLDKHSTRNQSAEEQSATASASKQIDEQSSRSLSADKPPTTVSVSNKHSTRNQSAEEQSATASASKQIDEQSSRNQSAEEQSATASASKQIDEQSSRNPSAEEQYATASASKQIDEQSSRNSDLFKEPAELIFTDKQTNKLNYNENTLQLLSEINKPLNVVGITGTFRTGKSYLLNRLAWREKTSEGFKTGHKVHACTKGIWIWCHPHPRHQDQVLVLMDVEGFGDSEKVNMKEDTWLFTLATLLTSVLVYNNKGPIDAHDLSRLNFLGEIESTIQVNKEAEKNLPVDLDFFFPTFVVALRDFHLELSDSCDKAFTPDEYFDRMLVTKRGEGKQIEEHNKVRRLIRRYFRRRRVFTLPLPCGPSVKLEQASDCELEPEFIKSITEIMSYILACEPLQLKSGRYISGRMLSNLIVHYVTAIGKGEQPSIVEATKKMAEAENDAAFQVASAIYQKKMQSYSASLDYMELSDEALEGAHRTYLNEALVYLKQAVVFDDEDIFKQKTLSIFKEMLQEFKRTCDENSDRTYQEALRKLNKRIENNLKNRVYHCVSGYDKYIADIDWLVKTYTRTTGTGEKSKRELKTFLDDKVKEEELVSMVSKAQGVGRDTNTTFSERLRSHRLDGSIYTTRKSLETKVGKLEESVCHELGVLQMHGMKKIQEKYVMQLDLALHDIDRQKQEANNEEVIKLLQQEHEYFLKVRDYAKTVGDNDDTEYNRMSDVFSENKKKKRLSTCTIQ